MLRPEQRLQTAVFNFLKPLMFFQGYRKFMAFQIRNETGVGGTKGAILGKIAKEMGTMSGVSDVLFLFPQKAVFVEFKARKSGKEAEKLLEDSQQKFKSRVETLGFEYKIIAASDEMDAINQATKILKDNDAYP